MKQFLNKRKIYLFPALSEVKYIHTGNLANSISDLKTDIGLYILQILFLLQAIPATIWSTKFLTLNSFNSLTTVVRMD